VSSETNPSHSPDAAARRAILALSLVPDVGSVTHKQLTETFRSASHALAAAFPPTVVTDAYARADACLQAGVAADLLLTTIIDDGYPPQLRHLHAPPPVLWTRGDWSTLRAPIVAIVGTRRATSYGLRVTREIASALARAGACIVSGMALGIDAAAHRAALDADGATVAVLGTGADLAYPRANTALYREIVARGLVMSELPPGEKSGPGSFPLRNRIIAGLASLTIVVEAPEGSGALYTANEALDLGRDLAAVPGPIDAPQSFAYNELLRNGAHVITSVAEAVRLAGLEQLPRLIPELRGEYETRIWNALKDGSATLDELCARTALPVSECLATVTALEVRGVVECALTGEVRRR